MVFRSIKRGIRARKEAEYSNALAKTDLELNKTTRRTEVINYLLNFLGRPTKYLEIGVRNPEDNFNHIDADIKYSVDPGLEAEDNKADFKLTSDDFFKQLKERKILTEDTIFDVIFVDGLHLAEQADRDIANAFEFLAKDGFVIVHDCNPPTIWHAREKFRYLYTPAEKYWNGTTWKAFVNWRLKEEYQSCCIDSDWGIGILSKKYSFGNETKLKNDFFEYGKFEANRQEFLNLLSFDDFKQRLNKA